MKPTTAQLLSISCPKDSPFAFFGQARDFAAPYPEIPGREPGYYGLEWNFGHFQGDDKLQACFSLVNEQGRTVDMLVLPANEYFSGHQIANTASGMFGPSEKTVAQLRKLFADAHNPVAKSRDPLDLANEFMNIQMKAFQAKIKEWINFPPEHDATLSNIHFMLASMIGFVSLGSDKEAIVALPEGTDLSPSK